MNGKAVFVSQGKKTHLLLKIPNYQYLGERLVCNGEKTSVAAAYVDKRYSTFGDFVKSQDAPMREGLLGGVLTTAWPLLDLNESKSKVVHEGLKKFEGKELYALRYKPKKSSDLDILLYFDPETFHHVATVYSFSIAPRVSLSEVQTARGQETRYRIEERFSEFKTGDGVTLPSHYELRFAAEVDQSAGTARVPRSGADTLTTSKSIDIYAVSSGVAQSMLRDAQRNRSASVEWDVTFTKATNNVHLDSRNFELK